MRFNLIHLGANFYALGNSFLFVPTLPNKYQEIEMKAKYLLIVSIILTSVGKACSDLVGKMQSKKMLLVLTENEYKSFDNFDLLKKKDDSLEISSHLYNSLLRDGRIVKIETKNSANCTGRLTD